VSGLIIAGILAILPVLLPVTKITGKRDDAKRLQIHSVVDPDPQGFGTFAESGSVTRRFRIRVHNRKWALTSTITIKKGVIL
jgi:hypothetical protein